MDQNKLLEIIKNGESSGVEFKEFLTDTDNLAQEIVAFLNMKGGLVLIGVADDGSITGAVDDIEETIMNVCRSKVQPSIIPFYEKNVFDGKTIVILTIPQGIDKPYCFFKSDRKTYYIRVGTTKREATREELRRLYQESALIHYDTLPVHNSLPADLNAGQIEEYFTVYRQMNFVHFSEEEKTRLLINAGLLVNTDKNMVCSVGALLLFGKEPDKFLYQSGITFAHYKSADVSDELVDRKAFNKTLVENIQNVCDAVKFNTIASSKITGIKREDEIVFPEKAVREAVVNACVHRDYTIFGAKIRVLLFNDRLVVRSPGLPPNTLTIENMKIGYPVHRNPLLVKFISDYPFFEGLGRGVPMIIKVMKEASGKEPDIRKEGEEIVVTLYKK